MDLFCLLEVDTTVRNDLMLIAHNGFVGKTCADHIMLDRLSIWALPPAYQVLSHKRTAAVQQMRMLFDRPPNTHKDLDEWSWEKYDKPPRDLWRWAPDLVPRGPGSRGIIKSNFRTGPGGEHMEHPDIWRWGVRIQDSGCT